MALEIDGFAVLGAIARAPGAFPALRPEVGKTARAFVGKQVKDRGLTIDGLREIAAAIGSEAFDLIADAMSDAEIKAILGKVDRLNAEIKGAPVSAQRKHVGDLARGAAMPSAKAVAAKAPKPAKATMPAVERSGNSKAMRAKKKA